MRYHKYKHKPGGYIRKRNRLGGFSTIPGKYYAPPGCGCCGCLLPCITSVIVIGLIIILF